MTAELPFTKPQSCTGLKFMGNVLQKEEENIAVVYLEMPDGNYLNPLSNFSMRNSKGRFRMIF
jgi:hypothetical protein